MKINDVVQRTGLSARAIRLYESRGLIDVPRSQNDYRDYGEEEIRRLSDICRFRLAGIALTDIRLFFDGVITFEELLRKREQEIRNEAENTGKQLHWLQQLSDHREFEPNGTFDEGAETETSKSSELMALGIDVGTTTISAVVTRTDGTSEAYTLLNHFHLTDDDPILREQDAEQICEKILRFVDFALKEYPQIASIGISGQMHGIVYIDAEGKACSGLITWQDGRAGIPDASGESAIDRIGRLTGRKIYAGYGLATLESDRANGKIPPSAVTFCSIGDYLVMRLTGRRTPLVHASDAHSFGLYDAGGFDRSAIETLGIPSSFLPEVVSEPCVAGTYCGIPVITAIGDNQAAFFGSAGDRNGTVLVNFGTGSQISVASEKALMEDGIEARPFLRDESYLISGSALCGGRAYATLERFFRSYLSETDRNAESQYETMNRLAERAFASGDHLPVNTAFCGTRTDPTVRGSIQSLSEQNFTPENLICGTLWGMAEELYGFYRKMNLATPDVLVASGNAVRRNPVLQKILARVFGCEVRISKYREEASTGVAWLSALVTGSVTAERLRSFYQYE